MNPQEYPLDQVFQLIKGHVINMSRDDFYKNKSALHHFMNCLILRVYFTGKTTSPVPSDFGQQFAHMIEFIENMDCKADSDNPLPEFESIVDDIPKEVKTPEGIMSVIIHKLTRWSQKE